VKADATATGEGKANHYFNNSDRAYPMELLTVKEVARRLRVSQSLVYQLVDTGRLGCHRIGNGRGAIRMRPEDVTNYLQSCRAEANSS
jgi:excisionase family DNA binding protein